MFLSLTRFIAGCNRDNYLCYCITIYDEFGVNRLSNALPSTAYKTDIQAYPL